MRVPDKQLDNSLISLHSEEKNQQKTCDDAHQRRQEESKYGI